MKCFIIVFGIILTAFIFLKVHNWHQEQELYPWRTCSALLYIANGCGEFKQQFGYWPNSLTDLCRSRPDIADRSNDSWGHELIFLPYDKKLGYGEIISYGRDEKPGGVGLDSDLVIRFPTQANTDWNKHQAMQVKLPDRLQSWTNWYDQYTN